jgi:carbon monoxide dehydrogenase subunit G
MRSIVAFAVLFVATVAGAAEPLVDATITAWKADGAIHVDASFHVDAPPAVAWQVLTDYEHMAAFVPTLRESRVLDTSDGRLVVLQKGVASVAWFSHDWEVEREVSLVPEVSIRSNAVRGNVKRMEMDALLAPEGAGVRIHYRTLTVPGFWVPPLIGPALMKSQATDQFRALAAEMLKRVAATPAPAPSGK